MNNWVVIDHGDGEIVIYDTSNEGVVCVFDDCDESYAWPEHYSISGESMYNAHKIVTAVKYHKELTWALDRVLNATCMEDYYNARGLLAKIKQHNESVGVI